MNDTKVAYSVFKMSDTGDSVLGMTKDTFYYNCMDNIFVDVINYINSDMDHSPNTKRLIDWVSSVDYPPVEITGGNVSFTIEFNFDSDGLHSDIFKVFSDHSDTFMVEQNLYFGLLPESLYIFISEILADNSHPFTEFIRAVIDKLYTFLNRATISLNDLGNINWFLSSYNAWKTKESLDPFITISILLDDRKYLSKGVIALCLPCT